MGFVRCSSRCSRPRGSDGICALLEAPLEAKSVGWDLCAARGEEGRMGFALCSSPRSRRGRSDGICALLEALLEARRDRYAARTAARFEEGWAGLARCSRR